MKAQELSKKRKDKLSAAILDVINEQAKQDWMLSGWEINFVLAHIAQSISLKELEEEHKVDNENLKQNPPN